MIIEMVWSLNLELPEIQTGQILDICFWGDKLSKYFESKF